MGHIRSPSGIRSTNLVLGRLRTVSADHNGRAGSKARNVLARLNTGMVGWNLTRGMDVCVYSVFVLSRVGSGLATGLLSVQGVLPTVCKVHNFRINSEWEHARGPNPLRYKMMMMISTSVDL
jgi:hypothetical protein